MMFDMSELRRNILALPDKVEEAVMKYGATEAVRLESEAKENRPWNDHTAHARQRLKGKCVRTPNGIRITLSHGVEYGIYLEFAHEKRYAIIYPTLRRKAPDVMSGLQGLFDRLGGV